MESKKIFITSALPYVNNQPHLGNIVGSVLGADVYSRYCKKKGVETVFICGTDEYGTATEMEALKKGVHPREIVETNRKLHMEVYNWMGIEFDSFGRTACPEHTTIVQDIFKKCYENGYFEKKELNQFYCESCAQFLADRYVEGECALCGFPDARGDQCDGCGKCLKVEELKNPKCSICRNTPVFKLSNHLYLRLDLLQNLIKSTMDTKIELWTENAKNIYREWLDKDLIARCMTRSLKYNWGVPVPLDDFSDKVFYVWFDAVIGYLSILSQARPDWEQFFNEAQLVQFMGKDNVFFHAFIFPGILLAANNNNHTVDIINSTEYLTFNGNKFSKSRKIGIFGMDLVEKDLGPSYLWRYYLLRKRPENKDSDFNVEEFILLVNSDLRSNLGNFCQRVFKFIEKKCDGKIKIDSLDSDDEKFVSDMNTLYSQYKDLMDQIKIRDSVNKALEISSRANKYVQELQDKKEKLLLGFQVSYSAILLLAHVFEPFIPEISKKIFKMCGTESSSLFPTNFEIVKEAEISKDISILFEPLTDIQLENLRSYIKPQEF